MVDRTVKPFREQRGGEILLKIGAISDEHGGPRISVVDHKDYQNAIRTLKKSLENTSILYDSLGEPVNINTAPWARVLEVIQVFLRDKCSGISVWSFTGR